MVNSGSVFGKTRFPFIFPCPTLILIGEGEYANAEIRRQHHHATQVLPHPHKKLIVGPMDEGAASHCMGENLGLVASLVFNWLDDLFAS